MAIGLDSSLPKQRPPVLAKPGSQQQPSMPTRAPQIADRTVQAAANNAYESGAGARQMAVNEMARPGVSRGKGHQYYGDVAQSAADTKGATDAAGLEMGAAQSNAAARLAYDNTMKQEQLANAGLLEQLRSNSSAERLAKQGWQQDLYETLMRGQMGLDSMYLDKTPLIDALYRS